MTFANSGAQGLPAHLPQSGAPPCRRAAFRPFVFRRVRRTPGPLIILKTSGLDRRGSWPRRLFFSIIIEDGAASANVHSVSSCLEFRLVPALVQVGSEFLKKTYRQAQTRILCVAVLNFKWFLEGGSEVVQGGSYISHLPPIHKSGQTVRGFLANRSGCGSIDTARDNLGPLADAHAGS